MKKFISVLLSAIMIFSLFSVCFTASAYSDYSDGISDIPCIYIQGQGSSIITADGEYVYHNGSAGKNGEGIDLGAAIEECLPYFEDAVLSDNWMPYREKLLEVVEPLYKELRLDQNGNPQYGTHMADTAWLNEQYQNRKAANGKYALRAYNFYIDWRLDPFETADILNTYIQNVKSVTGKNKVNVTARCEGTNVVGAYLARYGSSDINCLNLYISTLNGLDPLSSLFSGNMKIDIDSLNRFKNQKTLIGDEFINSCIDSFSGLLVETYASSGLSIAMKPVVAKLYKEAVVPVLRASYATMPGMWGLVDKKDYQTAKENIFAGVEEEYAGLIEKLDNYDEKVRQRIDDVLIDAMKSGTKISIWAKYGDYTMVPICEDNEVISDDAVALTDASFGATVTHMGKPFSEEYISNAEERGCARYISPDKVCDASTALLPDMTWIIYNSTHEDFPECIHELMARFIMSNGTMTVWSDKTAPQYLYCSDDQQTLSPLTAENGMRAVEDEEPTPLSIIERIIALVNSILALIRNFLDRLKIS